MTATRNLYQFTHPRTFILVAIMLFVLLLAAPPPVLAQFTFHVTKNDETNRATYSILVVSACTYRGTWEVDWGDGNTESFTTNRTRSRSHTYDDPGEYTIEFTFDCTELTGAKTLSSTITLTALSPSWGRYQGGQTPRYIDSQDAIFFLVRSNKDNTSAVCSIPATGESGTCQIDAAFNLPAPADCGTYAVQVVATRGNETVTITGSATKPCPAPPDSGNGEGGGGPVVYTGEQLLLTGLRVRAQYGLRSGIQFERRGESEVGIQSLIDGGLRDVVDVWGNADQEWEVCFPQGGSLVFLDAAMSPRVPEPVSGYSEEGHTCFAGNRAGTVVLLSGALPVAAWPQSIAQQSPAQARSLQDCMVRTNYILRFRETPGGAPLDYVDPWGAEVAGLLPHDVRLTALERTADWYKVDYHGTQGWVSARYVTPQGDCA